MKETDAAACQREFKDSRRERDVVACVKYYNRQRAHAIKRKILTPTPPLRRAHATEANRTEIDNLSRVLETKASLGPNAQTRGGTQSPSHEPLKGYSVEGRQHQIICDNCRGMGHAKQVRPSAIRSSSSFQQMLEALEYAKGQEQFREASDRSCVQ